ncbi:MAG: hypothetical protein COA36_12845 [Desulfotalea sp.]|nr:MAG: hypothetical protein COA36_12845 [Desulfotalea sp.]
MSDSSITHLKQLLTKVPRNTLILRFLFYLFPLLIFLCLGYYVFLQLNHEQDTSLLMREETERLNLAEKLVVRDLDILASDLSLLSSSEELVAFVSQGGYGNLQRLKKRFLFFSRDRKIYDKIRFIDRNGMEIVRINMDGNISTIIPKKDLQNKADRYYFKQTMQMISGKPYLSPLDLNVEGGEIQRPLKPVIRIAQKLVNSQGIPSGILILNYLAAPMLDRFQSVLPQNPNAVYSIVNNKGWWLCNPEKFREWGGQLGHKFGFQNQNPEAWRQIKTGDSGQFILEDEMFTYTRVRPYLKLITADAYSGNDNLYSGGDDWIIISQVSIHSIDYSSQALLPFFILVFFMVCVATWRFAQVQIIRDQWDGLAHLLVLAIDQSPAGIVLTDRNGNIEYVNECFCTLNGYSLESVIGDNLNVLKAGDMDPEVYEILWRTISSGCSWRGEFHNKRKDGSFYWAKAEISPVLDRQGKISHYIGIQEDITQQRLLSSELKAMASTDPLTGLYNRRHLYVQAKKEIARCQRYHTGLTVMLLDIDHFKVINDTWGHALGDYVLTELSTLLQANVRENDVLARYGGEEFIVLYPGIEEADACLLAERFRANIENLSLQHKNETIKFTVSIGCTQYKEDDIEIETTIARADRALYRAKESGRNKVETS